MSEEPAPKVNDLLAALEANVLYDVVLWLNNVAEDFWLDVDNIREHAVAVEWRDNEDYGKVHVWMILDTGLVLEAVVDYIVKDGEKLARYVEIDYRHMAACTC
jgi:hypothetical protein